MALIKFGMMMTDASGKLGGQVFSKNRGGSYVRTKVTPLNPQSSFQTSVRSIFASISSAWSTLTQVQRDSFNNFVAAYATTNIFGDLRNPSGKALFQRLNGNLQLTSQPQITTCVSPATVPFADMAVVELNLLGTALNAQPAGDTTGTRLYFFATAPLSQGTAFVKNRLRAIGVFSGSDGNGVDLLPAYNAKFGAITAGDNIVVGVKVVNSNGQASPLETVKVTYAT